MSHWWVGFLGAIAVAWVLAALRRVRRRREVESLGREVAAGIGRHFLVQPCPRCHEPEMQLIAISPGARSLHYACTHCEKQARAPASSPGAAEVLALHERFCDRLEAHDRRYPQRPLALEVSFCTPASPLPFEQTTRQPIAEAVRAEVWRRDQGRCVHCESRENLEFDHIIPLSRGGATSVRNLQLLCKACNRSKGATI